MHGGLSPDLNSMEQIRRVMRPTDVCFLYFANDLWSFIGIACADANFLTRSPTAVFSAISSGLTQIKISQVGARTTEVSPSPLGPMSFPDSCKSMIWI